MPNRFFAVFSLLLFASPAHATSKHLPLKRGEWKGALTLNDTTELPFTFTLALDSGWYTMIIHNATENISIEHIRVGKDDSVNWHMPVFDSWFKCRRQNDTLFTGIFYNRAASRPYELKFRAEYGKPRYPTIFWGPVLPQRVEGKWECDFSPGTSDSSKAIGIFKYDAPPGVRDVSKATVTGTFMTETGDYRYLEGNYLASNSFAVSCFDGSHAFVFAASIGTDRKMHGHAWYGKFGHEDWIAKRNENFQLRDPEKLTWITDSTNVNFTFNDLFGHPVSLSDPQFKGKVVIVQIMGSWCPNCMDETAFLSDVYKNYHPQGLEIIALAYERSTDTAKANPNIRRVRDRFGAQYTFLNTGKSGRDSASASLPFLNGIMSFPTTIYIDRTGKVRKVYTGFNGPATDAQYEKDTAETLRFIQQLLAEKP